MNRIVIVAWMTAIWIGALAGLKAAPQQEQPQPANAPTFSRDVAPILFKN